MARKPKVIDPFDVALGAVVRSKRIKRSMSQAEVAKQAGLPLSNYQRREDGSISITTAEIERLAAVLTTPAVRMVEEALEDYGGIEKLLASARALQAADSTVDLTNVGDPHEDDFEYTPGGPKKSDHALAANRRPKKVDTAPFAD